MPLIVAAQDSDSTLVGVFEDGRSYVEGTYTLYSSGDQYRIHRAYADGSEGMNELRKAKNGRFIILYDGTDTDEYYTISDEGLKIWDSEGLIVVCPWIERPK